MNLPVSTTLNWEQARALLGTSPQASDAEIRAAYLEQVRQHPPDRDPDQFERIRDAYEQLRDPRRRAQRIINGPDPLAPLADLLPKETEAADRRNFVGPEPWLAVLKEKRA